MAVTSPEQMTAAFEAAYNARDKAALMRLYAPDAVHTFDGVTLHQGIAVISRAFDRGFAATTMLRGRTLACLVTGDTALLRVRWHSVEPSGAVLRESISCEVVTKSADGLWRYIIDDATGGSRPR
jgi:ketosteroid isomerase-like protein